MRESWIAENSSLMFAMKKRMDSVCILSNCFLLRCIGVLAAGDHDNWKESRMTSCAWGIVNNTNALS